MIYYLKMVSHYREVIMMFALTGLIFGLVIGDFLAYTPKYRLWQDVINHSPDRFTFLYWQNVSNSYNYSVVRD